MGRSNLKSSAQHDQTGIVARERLFALLDQWRERPLIWISGPPGSGKTTLVASYLESRKLPNLSYRVEPDDADPAVFFQRLGELRGSRRITLPIFSDEYRAELRAFCKRFWPQFFARIRTGTIVSIDGLAPIADDATIVEILTQAMDMLPLGVRLIVTSRCEPPARLTAMQLQGDIGLLTWKDLRFDLAETRNFVSQSPTFDDKQLQDLHDQTAGWAAGLRMLLEQYRQHGHFSKNIQIRDQTALFTFLAAEVFTQLPRPTQNILLSTSFLPGIRQQGAEVLSRDRSAWPILADLCNRHLFVETVNGNELTFEYHALFKSFLHSQAREQLGAVEYRSLQQRTASYLAARGEAAHAIPLYASAGDWVAAARLILVESASLLARGQSQTLRGWVQSLPSWYVQATPRLLYCLGLSQCVLEPATGRRALELAYRRFVAEYNLLGQALAAAAIIQTYYFQFDAFDELDPWIIELEKLLRSELTFPTSETELHVCSMLQIAMTYRKPSDPYLAICAERVLSLVSRGLDINQSVAAAGLLLTHYDWFSPEKARLLVGFIQHLLIRKELTPFNRLWWLLSESNHYYFDGQITRARALFLEIRKIASSQGILPNHALIQMLDAMEANDTKLNLSDIDLMIDNLNPIRRQEEQNLMSAAIPVALRRGDHARALTYAERMLRLSRATGHRMCELEAYGWVATALCESGNATAGLAALHAARDILSDTELPRIEFHHLIIEANIRLAQQESSMAYELMGRALAIARANGYSSGFQLVPHILARLCEHALEQNIESQYVKRLIQINDLLPTSQLANESWPWHARIRVLGAVSIEVESIVLGFDSKAQKKPLALLKFLIAKGRRGVSHSLVAQELWPDSDGDAADSALRMAIHRLRKILQHDDAIFVFDGKIRLNDKICWVDAWSLDALCERVQKMNDQQLSAVRSQLLALYQGLPFEDEAEHAWVLLARDHWRDKFQRTVEQIGTAEERQNAWTKALELYRRGVEIDPLNEELYYRLMHCYFEQGKTAEAYSVYRRCKDVLSVTLGIRPSPRTEALRQRVASLGTSQ